jgi:hypothetical protein
VRATLSYLLKRNLPLQEADLLAVIEWALAQPSPAWACDQALVQALENFYASHCPTLRLAQAVRQLITELTPGSRVEHRRYAARLESILQPSKPVFPIEPGEAWADAALCYLASQPAAQKRAWADLLQAGLQASGTAPSAKWLRACEPAIETIGPDRLKAALLEWFGWVVKPQAYPGFRENGPDPDALISSDQASILRGLAWLCARQEDDELARALSQLAVAVYRKIPQAGSRSVKLGNGCLWALGHMPGQAGIHQLVVLKARLKMNTAQKAIDAALQTAAQRSGLSAEELEELSVPTYGLDEVGLGRAGLGEFTAELRVEGPGRGELRWLRPDGKPQASVPQSVKTEHGPALKELQQAVKDIHKMLAAQSARLEGLYLQQKSWTLETWRERYLDHPLVGVLARRLLWKFSQGDRAASGLWHAGRILGRDGAPLDWLTAGTHVELWHPLQVPVETVLAWRAWLAENEIQQPFKQAHREIYLLTDAELHTATYSNRFAAHILKQHQFNALCAARGWKNQLRLLVDTSYPPAARLLPEWGLRAEYWVEGIGANYGTDTNDTGTFLYLSTDQVRFYRLDAPPAGRQAWGGGYRGDSEPLALSQVPALVFSEIMRDVDLFVGVASVGNDPAWQDGQSDTHLRNYWQSYSFGSLSETAQTRKAVLEGLVPRLKIAARCSFRDRFLVVRGDLRTYKIHLGSGNILMEPNDQYLCIVPAAGPAPEKVLLPFAGDGLLAVILSKAFLLAEDWKITDPTILRQIRT